MIMQHENNLFVLHITGTGGGLQLIKNTNEGM